MTKEQKKEITKMSKQFASGFEWKIEDSGWLIVDPLSAYLNACGFENKLLQFPETKEHDLILIIVFKDGSRFMPAGINLKFVDKKAKNWMWI